METYLTFFLLTFGAVTGQQCPANCQATIKSYAFSPADETNSQFIYIGGIFDVHKPGTSRLACGDIDGRGVQNLEAFLWAVDTFNDRYVNALKGISIGAIAFDSCGNGLRAARNVLNIETCQVGYGIPVPVNPDRLLGYVGPSTNEEAADFIPVLESLTKTAISHSASAGSGNINEEYFFRTVPAISEEATALVGIVRNMDWKYVQTVSTSTSYASDGIAQFKTLAEKESICITQSLVIPNPASDSQMDSLLDNLADNQDTNVVVLYAEPNSVRKILMASSRKKMRGKFIWIGSSSWGINKEVVEGFETFAEGALTVTLGNSASGSGYFYNHLEGLKSSSEDPWLAEYLAYLQVTNLTGVELDIYTNYTIIAVDTILNAIETARASVCSSNGLCSQFINSANKLGLIRNAVTNGDYPIRFNSTTGGTISGKYAIYNFRAPHGNMAKHGYVQVGSYDKLDDEVHLSRSDVYEYDVDGNRISDISQLNPSCRSDLCEMCEIMFTEVTPPGVSTATVDASSESQDSSAQSEIRDDPWLIVLLVLTTLGIMAVVIFELYFLYKLSGTEIFSHWKSMWLGQLLLFAIFLCYLTLYAFIQRPSGPSCAIIRFGIGVTYAMCFSILLVKLMIIFSSEKYGSLQGTYQFLMFLFTWAVQVAVDIEWLVIQDVSVIGNPNGSGNMCWPEFKDHVLTLIYVMILIVICTILSIKAHRMETNHRESLFIGLASGVSIPIWLVWLLLGFLMDDPGYHEPCLAFGLWATATWILLVMFVPKAHQLSKGVDDFDEDELEGIPSVIHGGSILHDMSTGSIIGDGGTINTGIDPALLETDRDSIVFTPNGAYTQPIIKSSQFDPAALHLRHPGSPTYRTGSLASVPIGPHMAPHYATNPRVLHVSKDLLGLSGPQKKHTQSELNYNVYYGPAKLVANKSNGHPRAGTLKTARSIDLGPL